MNTVAIPADLLGAMAAGGGIASAEAASDGSGAFGKMLGALMESGQTIPQDIAQSVETDMEMPEETGINADIKAIAAAIVSGNEADVPAAKLFSEETVKAFAGTLLKFTEGDITPEDIKEIWQDVPAEEKAALAELITAVFTDNTPDKAQTEIPAEAAAPVLSQMPADTDMTAQPEMSAKQETGTTVKLPEMTEKAVPEVEITEIIQAVYKSAETEEAAPHEALSVKDIVKALLMAIRKNLNKGKTDDEEDSDKSAVYDAIAAFAPAVNRNILTAETAETVNTSEERTAQAVTSAEESVELPEVETEGIIQKVYNALETTDERELETFCKELAKVLEDQTSEVQTPEAAKLTEVHADNAKITAVNAFSSGRQAFMSRVRNAFEEETPQISAMIGMKEIPAAKAAIPEITEAVAEDTDISDQILQRIDLIEDIANMTAGSEKEITLNLAPEELGSLEIKIKNTQGGISIAFAAERSEAARLIGEKANILAEAVASRGMRVKEMSVTQQIVTEESHDNGMSYSGMNSGNRSYGGSQNEREPESYGRSFSFDADGNVTAGEPENGKEIYYNREAKLWLSA